MNPTLKTIQEGMKEVDIILSGIDYDETKRSDGWWETSTGAEFGAKKKKEIKHHTTSLIKQILQAEIERLQKEREPNLNVVREKGSEFTTPRMYRAFGRDDAIQDQIAHLQETIKELNNL